MALQTSIADLDISVSDHVLVQKKRKRESRTIESFWQLSPAKRLAPSIPPQVSTFFPSHITLPDGAKVIMSTCKSVIWCIRNFDTQHSYQDFEHLPLVKRPEVLLRGGRVGNANRDAAMFLMSDLCALESQKEIAGEKLQSHIYNHVLVRLLQDHTIEEIDAMRRMYMVGDWCRLLLKYGFNGVYANKYRDGDDCIGAHHDKEVLPDELVTAIAYGATRIFRIRERATNKMLLDIQHEHGMLICMAGWCQEEFKHEIPRQKKILAPRISLTYRRHSNLLNTSNDGVV